MKTTTRRILFFVPEWSALASGVLHSQVLSVARFLSAHGFECMFVGCEISDEKAAEATIKISDMYGIQALVLGIHANIFGYIGMLLTARKLYRLTKEAIHSFQPTHIYSRSITVSRFARKIASDTGALSVFDVRAALSDEVKMRRGNKGLRYWYIRYSEKIEFQKSNRLACVSENLKRYITDQMGREDITVIPSCFDQKKFSFDSKARTEIRSLYGMPEDCKVICYSGGLALWQRVNDIIALFEKLALINSHYRFLFLTKEIAQLQELLRSSRLPSDRVVVESCAQEEVYRFLSAADVGIIMREDTTVNNVASPIKIGEYLGCGLPLILTKGIGDFSELIPRTGIGLLLDETGDPAMQICAFMEKLDVVKIRDQAINFSNDHFSNEAHLQEYENLYG